jgi:hypothetical protein
MKTQVTAFGFEVLVTYLLPGILATMAVLVWHGIDIEGAKKLVAWAQDAQFLSSFLLLASFTLLGALVASLQALIEANFLDWLTSKMLDKEQTQFNVEWNHYINNLPENSYISRVALYFQFETRIGLASLILGLTLFKVSVVHAGVFILLGLVFYWIGSLHHRELGAFRENFFNETS